MIKIEVVERDLDSYEEMYFDSTGIEMGYYALGHIDKTRFLASVREFRPNIVIDTAHWGWWGRWHLWQTGRTTRDFDWKPRIPAISDVVHTYWRNRSGAFMRARPLTRGSSAVTYLPVEASGNLYDLGDIYDTSRQGWVPYFYPSLFTPYR